MKLFFVLSLIFLVSIKAQTIPCRATADDGSEYDLTPLIDRVLIAKDADSLPFSYEVKICRNDLTCGTCLTAGYCQIPYFGGNRYCIGKIADGQITGKDNGEGVELIYNNGDPANGVNRMGKVTINCNPATLIGTMKAISPATDVTKYEFIVESSAGCPINVLTNETMEVE